MPPILCTTFGEGNHAPAGDLIVAGLALVVLGLEDDGVALRLEREVLRREPGQLQLHQVTVVRHRNLWVKFPVLISKFFKFFDTCLNQTKSKSNLQVVGFGVLAGDGGERPGLEQVESLAEVGVVVVDQVGEGGVREEVGPVRQLQLPPARHRACRLFECETERGGS